MAPANIARDRADAMAGMWRYFAATPETLAVEVPLADGTLATINRRDYCAALALGMSCPRCGDVLAWCPDHAAWAREYRN